MRIVPVILHETAYPRLKRSISNEELHESYTPSADELALADEASKGTGPKICLLVLLKGFQRLGYFDRLRDVPKPIDDMNGPNLCFWLPWVKGEDIKASEVFFESDLCLKAGKTPLN